MLLGAVLGAVLQVAAAFDAPSPRICAQPLARHTLAECPAVVDVLRCGTWARRLNDAAPTTKPNETLQTVPT